MAYFRYLAKSGTRHSVHPPFAYKLVDEVLTNRKDHQAFHQISELRRNLSHNTQMIEITDFGTGKNHKGFSFRFESVSAIARQTSINEKYGRTLFRLVEHFKPQTIIEFGTSLGISSLYLAMAQPDAQVFTIEGCTTKSEQAATNFNSMQVSNIEQFIGRFDIVLPDVIKRAGRVDFAFIDGNHTYEATLSYFEALLQISNNDTVFVFDDIHWSAGMQKAWNEITEHEKVTTSIDLFRMGVVFLKKELSKQKFVIRY